MDDNQLVVDSVEAFMKRASELDMPFMVKGSIITRQYFPNPEMRKVADLDYVYLNYIDNDEHSGTIFSDWVTKVTESEINDNTKFRSFKENDFWRRIDYAMHDDFPTVDTDLKCWVNGQVNDRLSLDISYNLEIDFPPVTIKYKPRIGEPFLLKSTCPLPIQVAWKLHQLITRPRVKDVFDLIHLLNHLDFNENVLSQTLLVLMKECSRDDINLNRLLWYINGEMAEYHKLEEDKKTTTTRFNELDNEIWIFKDIDIIGINHYKWFTDKEHFDYNKLSDLFLDFSKALKENGITTDLVNKIASA